MTIKNLIANAFEGNAQKFQETFASLMSDRMEQSIAAKYNSMFAEAKEDDMEDDEEDEDGDDDDDDDDDDEDCE